MPYFNTAHQINGDDAYNKKDFELALKNYEEALNRLVRANNLPHYLDMIQRHISNYNLLQQPLEDLLAKLELFSYVLRIAINEKKQESCHFLRNECQTIAKHQIEEINRLHKRLIKNCKHSDSAQVENGYHALLYTALENAIMELETYLIHFPDDVVLEGNLDNLMTHLCLSIIKKNITGDIRMDRALVAELSNVYARESALAEIKFRKTA